MNSAAQTAGQTPERRGTGLRSTLAVSPPAQLAAAAIALWILFLLIPLSQTVSAQPAYLFAHATSRGEWLLLIVGACGVAAVAFLLLALLGAAIARQAPPAAAAVPAALVALLPAWAATDRLAAKLPGAMSLLLALALVAAVLFVAVRARVGVLFLALALCAAPLVTWAKLYRSAEARPAGGAPAIAWKGGDDERPNILLYVIDEGSAAAMMGPGGAVRASLPNLASLQRSSTTYTRAFATYPFTDIANPAIVGGLSSIGDLSEKQLAGLRLNSSGLLGPLSDRYDIWLYDAVGINCKGFPCNGSASGPQGSGAGLLAKDTAAILGDQFLPEPVAGRFPDTRTSFANFWADGSGSSASAQVASRLPYTPWADGRSGGRPWFYFLHTGRAHHPWELDAQGQAIYPRKAAYFPEAPLFGLCRKTQLFCTRPLADTSRALYANGLRQVDRDIGRVMASLKKSGEWENTMVAVTADHSNAIGVDRDGRRPGSVSANAELAWVPLLVKAPRQDRPGIVRTPRSTGQIMPTAISAGGGRVDPQATSPPLDRPAPATATFTPVKPGSQYTRERPIPLAVLDSRVRPWPTMPFRFNDEARYRPGLALPPGATLASAGSPSWSEAPLVRGSLFVSEGSSRLAGVQLTTSARCDPGRWPTGLLVQEGSGRILATVNWEAPGEDAGKGLRGWAIVKRSDRPASRWRAYCRS